MCMCVPECRSSEPHASSHACMSLEWSEGAPNPLEQLQMIMSYQVDTVYQTRALSQSSKQLSVVIGAAGCVPGTGPPAWLALYLK